MDLHKDRLSIEAILNALEFDQTELRRRKAYLQLSVSDEKLLEAIKPKLDALQDKIIRSFYDHLGKFEVTRKFFTDPVLTERLKIKQKNYIGELISGKYDWDYAINRLNVGITHQKIGLKPNWYIGAYAKFLSELIPEISRLYPERDKLAENTIIALLKAVFLDIDLIISTYMKADVVRISEDKEFSQNILANIPIGLMVVSSELRVQLSNDECGKMFGCDSSELQSRDIKELFPGIDIGVYANRVIVDRKAVNEIEVRCGINESEKKVCTLGIFPLNINNNPFERGQANLLFMISDVSEKLESQIEMAKLSSAIEQTADSVMITDSNGNIEYVNSGFESTTGYTREEVIGKRPSILNSSVHDGKFYNNLWTTISKGNVFREVLINRKKDGSLYYEEKTITPLRDASNHISHYISSGKDITERMHNQQKLQFLSQHDVLTNLPNRILFMERLTHVIDLANKNKRCCAVLFLDLDRFKDINDTLGHGVGDQLLRKVSRVLTRCLRDVDTVARLSGDEFALIIPELKDINDASLISNKLLDSMSHPFTVDEHELYMTTSIGIAIYPNDGENGQALLKNAEIAMYKSKEKGRGSFSYYTPDMHALAEARLTTQNELRQALHKNQFFLVYQPQVKLSGKKELVGLEVLLRWAHPERGVVPPTEFISLLEETGMIITVGQWVINSACTQLSEWRKSGINIDKVAVNISPCQLVASGFVEFVTRVLKETELLPENLELEITESSLMQDNLGATDILYQLHILGIHIAMDDFGTGYSSLSYLRNLPISTLKIDRSFIRHIIDDDADNELTRAIIAMGHILNLNVLAEGVETVEQMQLLVQHGCDSAQGYLFSKPLTSDDLREYYSSQAYNRGE